MNGVTQMKLKLLNMIKSYLYRLQYLNVTEQIIRGKYCVVYKDGCVSRRMDYSTAKNYAEIFDGKVIFRGDK